MERKRRSRQRRALLDETDRGGRRLSIRQCGTSGRLSTRRDRVLAGRWAQPEARSVRAPGPPRGDRGRRRTGTSTGELRGANPQRDWVVAGIVPRAYSSFMDDRGAAAAWTSRCRNPRGGQADVGAGG